MFTMGRERIILVLKRNKNSKRFLKGDGEEL